MPSFDVKPVTGNIGAEIAGVDLSVPVDEATASALRRALWDRHVLFLRNQFLDTAQLKRATELFGPLQRLPYVEPLPDDPHVIAVAKKAGDRKVGVFGGNWHSDFSFLDHPPAGSLLSAVEVPEVGGDTVWASQTAAYETLPADLKDAVDGRAAIHVGKPHGVKFAPKGDQRSTIKMVRNDPEADRETFHPAVRTHPETGRKALFVNPVYTSRLDGLSEAESEPILDRLYWHATRPEFCCRHRWRAGDLAIWDNRSTLHFAVNDYDGFDRLLYRTTFSDSCRPFA